MTVEHAPDCVTYSSYASPVLTLDDQRFSVALDPSTDTTPLCVRLGLSVADGEPVLDNVTVVPEPTLALQLLLGGLGLGAITMHHRRRTR